MTNIRWAGFSHAEIYQRVQAGPGRAASSAVESAWADTEAVIRGIEERLVLAIRETGSGWEGAAGDATRAGLTPLGQWAADAAGDAKLTAAGISAQGEQAAWLRNAMPAPTAPLWDEPAGRPASDPLYLLEDAQALEQKADADAAQAVHLMNTYTSNSYDNIRMLNYWTLPPEVTIETVGTPAAGAAPHSAGSRPDPSPVGLVPPVGVPGAGGGRTTGSGARRPGLGKPATRAAARAPAVEESGPPVIGGPVTRGVNPAGPGRPVPGATGVTPRHGSSPTLIPGSAPRTPPTGPGPVGGVRPAVPGPPPRPTPEPSWRDLSPGAAPRDPSSWPRTGPDLPGSTRRVPAGEPAGTAVRAPGAEPAEPAGRGRPPLPGSTAIEPARATAAMGTGSRSGSPAQTGLYPPMLGFGAGATDHEHRRPDYLLDDGGAFADDRWFPPPVIGPDDVPPPWSR